MRKVSFVFFMMAAFLVSGSLFADGLLGEVVQLKDDGVSFQPPVKWERKAETKEWQSTLEADKSSNMNLKVTPGSGKEDSLVQNKDAFIDLLKKEYAKIKQGKFALDKAGVETWSGKKCLTTYGTAEMTVKGQMVKMKNIQVFFETPKKIFIFTFTTLVKDYEKVLPSIKATLGTIKSL